jgi:ankyrin repeat protein
MKKIIVLSLVLISHVLYARSGEDFLKAVKEGNMVKAESFLDKGVDVQSWQTFGDTALHIAALRGDVKMGELLIKRGASVKAINFGSSTPLHLASNKGHAAFINLLISKGADVNTADKWGRRPLHIAAVSGHSTVVKILVSGGADVNARDLKDRTPLYSIARLLKITPAHVDCALILINAKASVDAAISPEKENENYYNRYDWEEKKTPLLWACLNGHNELAALLISRGADLNHKDIKGDTALHFAAYKGNLAIVKLLLEAKAEVNAADGKGDTPLIMAVKTSFPGMGNYWGRKTFIGLLKSRENYFRALDIDKIRPEIVKILLLNKCDINAAGKAGMTALHWAAYNGFTDIVKILVENRCGIDVKDKDKMTPFYIAVREGHKDIAMLLINSGASVDVRVPNSWADQAEGDDEPRVVTPLHWSIRNGMNDVTGILVAKGAPLNLRDRNGTTPLNIAAGRCNIEIVKLLLSKGADPALGDDFNNFPGDASTCDGVKKLLQWKKQGK